MAYFASMEQISLAELRRHNLLKTLLQHQVVAEALASENLEAEQLEHARTQFMRQNRLDSNEAFEAFLHENALSEADLDWQIALPLRKRAYCNEHFRHKAEAHFLTRKNQLDTVVYSLLRVQDYFLARELYLRIQARESNFTDLAAQYAEGPEKQTKGIVGPVPLTQAHPALAEMLRTTAVGMLMEPFQIGEWWLVVRLESYTPASFDEKTADRMSDELFNQWVSEETRRRIRLLMVDGVAAVQE